MGFARVGTEVGPEARIGAWFGPMLPDTEATWGAPGPAGIEAEEAQGP